MATTTSNYSKDLKKSFCYNKVMDPLPPEYKPLSLPFIEPNILGLRVGEVRSDDSGRTQVYFGGSSVESITKLRTDSLRDGAVQVDMYTINGRDDVDYAYITISTKSSHRSPTERGRALRGLATSEPEDYIERTPVQYFFSKRGFIDIPISGRARWLALDPDSNFTEGVFDDREVGGNELVAMFGIGWTFVWIVEGSKPFTFGELCNPRFIDESDDYPLGEEGINEIDTAEELHKLPQIFQDRFVHYTSGEQFRTKAAL